MERIIRVLKEECRNLQVPVVTLVARTKDDPYRVLISCLLSLRTNDATTVGATDRLFKIADTPDKMVLVPVRRLERIIYPVGFYHVKARILKDISSQLLENYGGKVPSDLDELLKFKGVGRKTANLVRTLGFGKSGICVDIHVHRISNRLGFVQTRTPDETEFALRKRLPGKYWIEYNDTLVAYGQHLCRPVSPHCSRCKVRSDCRQVGVTSRR